MRRSLFFMLFGVALCFCAMTQAAQAQATRTWVSGVGDDANPCSRTAPCKTWAGAIAKTTAGGEIDALDPGGFGALTITKSITLDGGGGQVASVLVAGSNGLVFAGGATDRVTIRNLSINGINGSPSTAGVNGIRMISGLYLDIQHCWIQNFSNAGIDIETNVRGFVSVDSTIVENNTFAGLYSTSAATTGGFNRVTINNSSFLNGGIGIKSGTNSHIQVSNSVVSGNGVGGTGDFGILADGTASQIDIEATTISHNQLGALHSRNNAAIGFSNSTITFNNGTALFFELGGALLTWQNNRVAGNAAPGATSGTLSLQ